MEIEARQMFRSNGLIDDLVVYATRAEYLLLAESVGNAVKCQSRVSLPCASGISIEIYCDDTADELFTSLQNRANEYSSMEEWNSRDILRVYGSDIVLSSLQAFFIELAERGEGYSYISEFSPEYRYSRYSPEWRLCIEIT
ncbi:hypothetical protein [Agarivorans sp. JK6]|uniref:hypothetical protein n=1 Tax=Agarivorans sp. JK6 TaxID=2997426 RepID=UPI00387343EE